MKPQINKYFFGRHRNLWGVYQWTTVTENGAMGTFIKDVFTYEEAVKSAGYSNHLNQYFI